MSRSVSQLHGLLLAGLWTRELAAIDVTLGGGPLLGRSLEALAAGWRLIDGGPGARSFNELRARSRPSARPGGRVAKDRPASRTGEVRAAWMSRPAPPPRAWGQDAGLSTLAGSIKRVRPRRVGHRPPAAAELAGLPARAGVGLLGRWAAATPVEASPTYSPQPPAQTTSLALRHARSAGAKGRVEKGGTASTPQPGEGRSWLNQMLERSADRMLRLGGQVPPERTRILIAGARTAVAGGRTAPVELLTSLAEPAFPNASIRQEAVQVSYGSSGAALTDDRPGLSRPPIGSTRSAERSPTSRGPAVMDETRAPGPADGAWPAQDLPDESAPWIGTGSAPPAKGAPVGVQGTGRAGLFSLPTLMANQLRQPPGTTGRLPVTRPEAFHDQVASRVSDDLAALVKEILDEQARRHGIDV